MTPPDSVLHSLHLPEAYDIEPYGRRKHLLNGPQPLNCLPWSAWSPVPESTTSADPFLQPHLLLFSFLTVLVGEMLAHPLSKSVSMMGSVQREC